MRGALVVQHVEVGHLIAHVQFTVRTNRQGSPRKAVSV